MRSETPASIRVAHDWDYLRRNPGDYRIEAVKPGFKPLSRTGVELGPDSTATVDLRMEDVEVSEAVTLEARKASPGSLLVYLCSPLLGPRRRATHRMRRSGPKYARAVRLDRPAPFADMGRCGVLCLSVECFGFMGQGLVRPCQWERNLRKVLPHTPSSNALTSARCEVNRPGSTSFPLARVPHVPHLN